MYINNEDWHSDRPIPTALNKRSNNEKKKESKFSFFLLFAQSFSILEINL